MPIVKRRLEWTMPKDDWKRMSYFQLEQFLSSKGFNLGKTIITESQNLIHIIQEAENEDQDKIEKLRGKSFIGSLEEESIKMYKEETVKDKIKGLQFYPFYKPE